MSAPEFINLVVVVRELLIVRLFAATANSEPIASLVEDVGLGEISSDRAENNEDRGQL